jgi:hypothetical protein
MGAMTFQDWLDIGNLLVVAATGVIVWIYTKAAQRSNEIQEQPLLDFIFKETPRTGGARLGRLSIKNIGKWPAYNISIEPMMLSGYRYKFFLDNPVLGSMEEASPRAAVRTPTGATEIFDQDLMWFLVRLIPQNLTPEVVEQAKNNPAFFIARYQGANGKSYHSVFALYCNLPPVGDIIMQFVAHGSGSFSLTDAKGVWAQVAKVNSPFSD